MFFSLAYERFFPQAFSTVGIVAGSSLSTGFILPPGDFGGYTVLSIALTYKFFPAGRSFFLGMPAAQTGKATITTFILFWMNKRLAAKIAEFHSRIDV